MRRIALLSLALLQAACVQHIGRPDVPEARLASQQAFTVARNIGYSPTGWPKALLADLYLPEDTRRSRPAVLLIHGGGWMGPDRREQMASMAERMAERGYVVMNANYRYVPDAQYPAPIEDLREALRWLRANAAEYRVDGQRVAAAGYSAGAHLAAQLGVLDGPPQVRVQAVIAGGTPTDLRKYKGGTMVPNFMGGQLNEMPQRFAEASPISHVSADDPPVFLYHGGMDLLVPIDHAEDFKTALDAVGVPCELFVLRGREHVTAFLTDGPAIDAAIEFLDRKLAP